MFVKDVVQYILILKLYPFAVVDDKRVKLFCHAVFSPPFEVDEPIALEK